MTHLTRIYDPDMADMENAESKGTINILRRPTRLQMEGKTIQLARFGVILAFLLLLCAFLTPPTAFAQTGSRAHCTPLVVTIEGGSTVSGGKSMERLAKQLAGEVDVHIVNVDNKYFYGIKGFFDILVMDQDNADGLANYLADLGLWPIVILGHSLGGATAHYVASKIPVSLLVTLDAVSRPDDVRHPGYGAKWINVYAHNHWWGLGDSIGEDWEHEPNADINLKLTSTRHKAVVPMFNAAAKDVYRALRSCTRSPYPNSGFNREVFRQLCAIDDVDCRQFPSR